MTIVSADCAASKGQNHLKPFTGGDDPDLILWQALLHVANHGTEHRTQILRALNDLGVKTAPQDYIFCVYGSS